MRTCEPRTKYCWENSWSLHSCFPWKHETLHLLKHCLSPCNNTTAANCWTTYPSNNPKKTNVFSESTGLFHHWVKCLWQSTANSCQLLTLMKIKLNIVIISRLSAWATLGVYMGLSYGGSKSPFQARLCMVGVTHHIYAQIFYRENSSET